jgi:hypothetical protein
MDGQREHFSSGRDRDITGTHGRSARERYQHHDGEFPEIRASRSPIAR